MKATEALEQANKEREAVVASVALARSECVVYFATLALEYKDRFADLLTFFNEERVRKPDWYGEIALDEPSIPTEEGDDEGGED
ncbi:hypothetical protein LIER_01084 [Lithospermum erythrorhizon]|uniref:Uncharacterized protein n=1 Tax=Lithospermum erythrorhizon TaxID=34254 RepID=A0AAV3NM26_LITER